MKRIYLIASLGLFIAITPALKAQETGKNHAGGKDRQARLLARFDLNHNGVLDPDEQAALDKFKADKKAEMLAKFDKNGDGKLDKTEREAMKAERKAHGGKHHQTPLTTGTEATPKP